MKTLKQIIPIFILCMLGAGSDNNDEIDNQEKLYGYWQIDEQAKTTGIVGLSQEEADAFIGKEYIFTPKTAVIPENDLGEGNRRYEVIENPQYTLIEYDGDAFWGMRSYFKEELGIKEDMIKVWEIVDPQKGNKAREWVVVKGDTLIGCIEGVFFFLKKTATCKYK